MIKEFFAFLSNCDDRGTIYLIEFGILVVACVFTFLGRVVLSDSGQVFGKTYGKVNYLTTFIKHLSTTLGFLVFLALILIWLYDFLGNFKRITLWYFLLSVVGAGIWLGLFFKGMDKEEKKKEEIEDKHTDEIDAIVKENPVFSAALQFLESDPDVQTVRVYNDGIAFYNTIQSTPTYPKPFIRANSNGEASRAIKAELSKWLAMEGTVLRANADSTMKYVDFGFANASEDSMKSMAKHLARLLSPRFVYAENKRIIEHRATITTSSTVTGIDLNTGKFTGSGGSSKQIWACESNLSR